MKKGKVYLVGAGPGHYKLISIKGLECIKKADVIVYDRLASKELLSFAKPDAQIVYVGKKAGEHTFSQGDINQLLIQNAKDGKVVARLKGGDPFIFGRGGEEAVSLAENNIDFEVVPGISSAYAVPAYAGIPVTHRLLSSTVAFVTGHLDPARAKKINWQGLVNAVETIIFLMSVRNLAEIVEKLLIHGRSENTPVAVIRWGATAKQQTLIGTLKTIVKQVAEKKFSAPAVVVVGEVVNLREKLQWFEKKPLFGKRILVTRAYEQAQEFIEALEELGAEAIGLPTIKIVAPENYEDLDRAILKISESRAPVYDWIIFTSVNGVTAFAERLRALGKDVRALKGIKLAAIGPGTAKGLEKLGLLVDFLPRKYQAEAIIEELGEVKGLKILIPRAEVAREILPSQLRIQGAEVEVATAYRTVMDAEACAKIRKLILNREIDIITFTSSSTIKNFVKALEGIDFKKELEGVFIACIGPITAKTAEELGFEVGVIAEEYTISGLIESLAKAFGFPSETR